MLVPGDNKESQGRRWVVCLDWKQRAPPLCLICKEVVFNLGRHGVHASAQPAVRGWRKKGFWADVVFFSPPLPSGTQAENVPAKLKQLHDDKETFCSGFGFKGIGMFVFGCFFFSPFFCTFSGDLHSKPGLYPTVVVSPTQFA